MPGIQSYKTLLRGLCLKLGHALLNCQRNLKCYHPVTKQVQDCDSRTVRPHNCKELYLLYSWSSLTMITHSVKLKWIKKKMSQHRQPSPASNSALLSVPIALVLWVFFFAMCIFLQSSAGPQALDSAIWIMSLIYWPSPSPAPEWLSLYVPEGPVKFVSSPRGHFCTSPISKGPAGVKIRGKRKENQMGQVGKSCLWLVHGLFIFWNFTRSQWSNRIMTISIQ